MSTDLEQRPDAAKTSDKDLIPMAERGLALRSLDDMFRFAQYIAQSRLSPKGLESPSQILLAMQMGAEMGLPPMASIQNIAVINGRPSIWGDAALAVCQEHPNFLDIDEDYDDETSTAICKVYTRKRGMDRPIIRTFTIDDAKKAQLLGKAGPWSQYQKRMQQLRARGFALRDAFPGALRGLLTAEEARDLPPRIVENEADDAPQEGKMAALVGKVKPAITVPAETTAQDAPGASETPKPEPKPTTPAKAKPAPAKPAPVVESEPEPEQEEPPFDIEPDPEGREPGADDDLGDEDGDDGTPVTTGQLARIEALKKEKVVAPRQFINLLVDAGNEAAKVATLTAVQAVKLIAALEKLK